MDRAGVPPADAALAVPAVAPVDEAFGGTPASWSEPKRAPASGGYFGVWNSEYG